VLNVKPVINAKKCTSCGSCKDVCPQELFEFKNGKIVVIKGECLGCKVCEAVCENKAVKVEE
jgi:NAD-dependent dihydropyrimidine dehydrogenase PreA subunit